MQTNYHINFIPCEFSQQHYLAVFHKSRSDSKSPQVSKILPSILTNLNNAVV